MKTSQIINDPDFDRSEIILNCSNQEILSDYEYKEMLVDKIEGLASAFNRLKNAIDKREDSEID